MTNEGRGRLEIITHIPFTTTAQSEPRSLPMSRYSAQNRHPLQASIARDDDLNLDELHSLIRGAK